ncbi:hypothetical protein [Rathayibacter rathayi]|uniref:hypothetical protein n=2 Tax=Rathayibacter rathayi TaxID=33887 RepID=UPI0015E41145|nr:hypothetical protein [Rathayibacter rathayi]
MSLSVIHKGLSAEWVKFEFGDCADDVGEFMESAAVAGREYFPVSVAVLPASGSVAKQLTTSIRYLAGRQVLAWDGLLTNGTVAPAGSYAMRITTTTRDGRTSVQTLGFTQP